MKWDQYFRKIQQYKVDSDSGSVEMVPLSYFTPHTAIFSLVHPAFVRVVWSVCAIDSSVSCGFLSSDSNMSWSRSYLKQVLSSLRLSFIVSIRCLGCGVQWLQWLMTECSGGYTTVSFINVSLGQQRTDLTIPDQFQVETRQASKTHPNQNELNTKDMTAQAQTGLWYDWLRGSK